MSRSMALIRFNDGTILIGCYNGTADALNPWLITDKNICENYENIFEWNDDCWRKHDSENDAILPTNEEDVEIFVGDGMEGTSWNGKASKSALTVTEGLYLDDNEDIDYDNKPEWVDEYVEHNEYFYNSSFKLSL